MGNKEQEKERVIYKMLKYIYTNQYNESIEFHEGSPFHITEIDGQSVNDIDISEASTINQIGATVSGTTVNPKDIDIVGDFRDSYQNRRELLDTIIPGAGKWRMIDDYLDVYLDVEIKQTPDIAPQDKVYRPFDFTIHAAYPYWKSTSESKIQFTELNSLFRFPRSFSNMVKWKISEKKIKQLQTIINQGSDETGFIVKFKADTEVQSPELLNVKTQEHIRFTDFTMQPDDVIVVSTYENQKYVRLIRNGEETNIFNFMDDDSTFFKLAKGENTIRYGASSNESNLFVTLNFETTYVGV